MSTKRPKCPINKTTCPYIWKGICCLDGAKDICWDYISYTDKKKKEEKEKE